MEDACSPTTLSFVDDTRDDTVAGEKAHVVKQAAGGVANWSYKSLA